jgi:branched-chain amino acid aminotransferase
MLATIPITKTSASRMTPELRDTAAFGAVFSDHMLVADFVSGKWTEPRIVPYGAQPLPAAPACAHYGQGIFEGFKALSARQWRRGGLAPPDANLTRAWHEDCQRSGHAGSAPDVDLSSTARSRWSSRYGKWIHEVPNSAHYVRPVLFATGETLGVKPSESFRFVIETCPSAPYFSGSVDLIAEDTYVRAFPGGTARPSAAETTPAACSPQSKRRRRASTTCCGSTASSAGTSKRPG